MRTQLTGMIRRAIDFKSNTVTKMAMLGNNLLRKSIFCWTGMAAPCLFFGHVLEAGKR
ncbi:hypothetical protein IV454_02330 [Massilia antarctica]|uniref:Uncharacterized protein n=1 Tax=Massilia antarctica TaxID=2765360 RepID=A0AA49A9A5_9BURK|nr:hypothetical protein [Massilia antarctica]QPI50480.1 hypothetical protein IV454_02330 [Massilia antarctica]